MSPRPRIFYGWFIVLVSALGLFLGAPLLVFSFSIFFKPLVEDFHASRAAVSLAFSLFNFVGALWLPGTGVLIDRFGARRVILISTVLFGVVLCSALWVGSGLWQLYLLFSILGIAMASGPAPVPYAAVISHWFDRRRGLALSLCMMGIGIGSIVVPILVAATHQRATAGASRSPSSEPPSFCFPRPPSLPSSKTIPRSSACIRTATLAPVTRTRPRKAPSASPGTRSGTAPPSGSSSASSSSSESPCTAPSFISSAILTDRGITAQRAALATSLVGAAVLIGRLGSGYLMDFVFAPRVAMLFFGATTVGIVMLCTGMHSGPRTPRIVPRRPRHRSRSRNPRLHDQPLLRPALLRHCLWRCIRRLHDRRIDRRPADGRRIRPLPLLHHRSHRAQRPQCFWRCFCSPSSGHTASPRSHVFRNPLRSNFPIRSEAHTSSPKEN